MQEKNAGRPQAIATAACAAAAVLTALAACSGRVGGAPQAPALAAASDSTVALAWEQPGPGTPDGYVVYFRPVGTDRYCPIAEPAATGYEHDPAGMTGRYLVAARFGPDLYYAAETLSTVPVATLEVALAELNASGNSGFGWDRATGAGRSYPMDRVASAAGVDLFVTDFDTGYGGPAYALASPTFGPSDPSGAVPGRAEDWRLNRFSALLPDERAPLPRYDEQEYQPFREAAPGFTGGVRTEDNHYALVKVVSVDPLAGELRLRSWFQRVPGLRLTRR